MAIPKGVCAPITGVTHRGRSFQTRSPVCDPGPILSTWHSRLIRRDIEVIYVIQENHVPTH